MADPIVRRVTSAGSIGATPAVTLDKFGNYVVKPWLDRLVEDGLMFVAGDADENDLVVGQTSFVATTPTFLLVVPSGTIATPQFVHLNQAQEGTVAGGDITVTLSFDKINRYSSGGTSETITAMRTDKPTSPACLLYSGATAAAASDARVIYSSDAQPIGGATASLSVAHFHLVNGRDFIAPKLVGPAAFLVFTYAGTTGPGWIWSIGWSEEPNVTATG